MRSRDSRGFRICISVYLNGLYLLCRLLLKHELGLTLKIFRQKFSPISKRHTAPIYFNPNFKFSYTKTYKTEKLTNLTIFAFLTISSALIGFYLSLSLFQKKRKILAEVKMKKLDVNHGGTSSDAFFLKSRSLCPVFL